MSEKEPNTMNDTDDDVPIFNPSLKKKKKKKTTIQVDDGEYEYQFLVDRIFNLMQENNPGRSLTEDSKFKIPPPILGKDGTRITVWTNFADICDKMNRKYDHVRDYALAEMGTTGSLDAEKRFNIKGRFQPKQIQTVLRHYIDEYVICRTCKSPKTAMDREKQQRVNFIQCQQCGSRRTVATIKAGFHAQIGKRKE